MHPIGEKRKLHFSSDAIWVSWWNLGKWGIELHCLLLVFEGFNYDIHLALMLIYRKHMYCQMSSANLWNLRGLDWTYPQPYVHSLGLGWKSWIAWNHEIIIKRWNLIRAIKLRNRSIRDPWNQSTSHCNKSILCWLCVCVCCIKTALDADTAGPRLGHVFVLASVPVNRCCIVIDDMHGVREQTSSTPSDMKEKKYFIKHHYLLQ